MITEKELNRYLKEIKNFKEKFEKAMDDDFNTPEAIGIIFNFINQSNKYLEIKKPNPDLCKYSLDILIKLGNVLTLFQEKKSLNIKNGEKTLNNLKKILNQYQDSREENNIDKIINLILNIREDARKSKDWETSDNIRDSLKKIGFDIQDTNNGPIWRKNIEI